MQWERLNYWKILICFLKRYVFVRLCSPSCLCDHFSHWLWCWPTSHAPNACLPEWNVTFVIHCRIRKFLYICICDFVFLWYIPSTHACMNQLMNEMPPSSYDPLTQWGLCVFWYYQKKTPSMRNCPCLWFTRPFGHWPKIIPIIFFCPWIWMVLLMLQSFYEE